MYTFIAVFQYLTAF